MLAARLTAPNRLEIAQIDRVAERGKRGKVVLRVAGS